MHQPSGTHTRQKIHTKYKTMQQDGSIMTTHTTQVSLPYKKQLNWPSLSVRRLQGRLVLFYKIYHPEYCLPHSPLFTNTPQKYTTHLKHKQKQLHIQTTQHINRHIQIQLLSTNNHRLEFTAILMGSRVIIMTLGEDQYKFIKS